MRRHTHRKSGPIRPQWKGTEEAQPLTNAEQAAFDHMMTTWTDKQFLDCFEEPPAVVRAYT